MTKAEKIEQLIKDMSESELIEINNAYCDAIRSEDYVHANDEHFFDTYFAGASPLEVLQRAHFGDYNWSHECVRFNGYGNLESFDHFSVDDLCEFPSTMAEYIAENEQDFDHIFDFGEIEEELTEE